MLKLGNVLLSGMPRIAVSFKDGFSPAKLAEIRQRGIRVAELRIDQFGSLDWAHIDREIQKFRHFARIATIRHRKEGGLWEKKEQARLALFYSVLPLVDGVDLELSSGIVKEVVREAGRLKKKIILSYHNFYKTPDFKVLNSLVLRAKAAGADIVKIAAMPLKDRDIETLAQLTLTHKSQNIVTIAMGRKGMLTRLLFPSLGSLMTYSFAGKSMAPGQMDYATMLKWMKEFYPALD
jgi:3-dehydroquinate dehydratase I